MKTQQTKFVGLLFISFLLLQGCVADLRTKLIKKEGITSVNTKKGKELLLKAWKKQGFDNLQKHQVYSFTGNDSWKGILGTLGKIWPERKGTMDFKYEIGTFDGQLTFKTGKLEGTTVGLQNWKYYEVSPEKDTLFKKAPKRIEFGLAAFQYFTEMIDRLKNAPIISFAGEKEFKGQNYDLVFCSWKTEKPHDENDQYIAWINQKTGLLDYTQYTLRENYMKPPGYKMVYGAVEYGNLKNINGVLVPHEQTVYAFGIKKKKKKNIHQLLISDFKFDAFDKEELRIDKTYKKGGDFKN